MKITKTQLEQLVNEAIKGLNEDMDSYSIEAFGPASTSGYKYVLVRERSGSFLSNNDRITDKLSKARLFASPAQAKGWLTKNPSKEAYRILEVVLSIQDY